MPTLTVQRRTGRMHGQHSMPQTFTIPDFQKEWPFPPVDHPCYESVSVASSQWVKGFQALDEKAYAAFEKWKVPLLASFGYPSADVVHFRLACDMLCWMFVVDEFSDLWDCTSAREMVSCLLGILQSERFHRTYFARLNAFQGSAETSLYKRIGHRKNDSEVSQDNVAKHVSSHPSVSVWAQTLKFASASTAKRFTASFTGTLQAASMEAEDRDHKRVRSIAEYLPLRRGTSGMKPCFDLLLLSTDIPEQIIAHPRVESLTWGAVDIIALSNDVYSWNSERARGLDGHNIVTVVMSEKKLDVQDAIDYVGDMWRQLAEKFIEDMNEIPTFSKDIDPLVSEYISGLRNWVSGMLEWSFQSERYFGTEGPEIKVGRTVELVSRPQDK